MFTLASPVHATPETESSPNGGAYPSGVTSVGGLVVDLIGSNNARVTAQLAASNMYVGYASSDPQIIGIQTGFTATLLSALGGGLNSASFRVTLFDGDSSPGDFDSNENAFLANGILIGNWSDVTGYETDSTGTALLSTGAGFSDSELDTGFFTLTDAGSLANLYNSLLASNQIAYSLDDVDPFDNFYDFTQGVDGGLINAGQAPVVTPPTGAVPEPATWATMLLGFFALGGLLRNRRRKAKVAVSYT